jgi:hypothetical protein
MWASDAAQVGKEEEGWISSIDLSSSWLNRKDKFNSA